MGEANEGTPWYDWVGELFEPVFGATIDDLVAREEEPKNKPRTKHISVYDPEAVRKVYEKVHMMTVLDEEMKKQRREQDTRPRKVEKKTVTQTILESEMVGTPDERPDQVTVNLNESCIWDSDEIGVLREAFKSIKKKNIEAMVVARETIKRNQELEALTAKQSKVIESQKNKLTEARNANSRLKINVDSLNEEVMYLTAKVGAMEEVIRELKQEQTDMVEELHENRVTTDKERMERERIQIRLSTLKQEALAEKMAAEDKIRTMCRQAIHDLMEKVKKLELQLHEERTKRKTTEKGLNHLRTHFSSLSVQDILPRNAVESNQVEHVQY